MQSSAALTDWKKTEELAFLTEVSSVPLQQALRHLQTAFANFFAKRSKYPRHKSRKKSRAGAEYTRSGFKWREGRLTLAKMTEPLDIRWSRSLHSGTTASMRMFTELLMLVTRFGLVLPAELAAVFRAMATLEGTLVHLSPGFDTVAEAKRYAGARMSEQLGTGNLREMASGELIALLPTLRRLPRRLDRITDQLHKGRFTVQARMFAHPEDRRLLRSVVRRAVMTVLAVVTGFMSVGLFNVTERPGVAWPELATHTQALNLLAWLLLAATAMFVLRLLVDMVRDGGERERR